MTANSEIIYTAGQIDEAVLLVQLLAERDIDAQIENEVLQGSLGGLPPGEATNPRVRVAAGDVNKAREVVKAFEYQQRIGRERVEESEDDSDEHCDDHWADWPACPQCHRRRQTVCPVCETAGSDLPLADANHDGLAPLLGPNKDVGDASRPLVICTTCDEPFAPTFYRVCQWCGHEFPDGLAPPPPEPPAERLSGRTMAVILALAALLAAIGAYFWWLTGQ